MLQLIVLRQYVLLLLLLKFVGPPLSKRVHPTKTKKKPNSSPPTSVAVGRYGETLGNALLRLVINSFFIRSFLPKP